MQLTRWNIDTSRCSLSPWIQKRFHTTRTATSLTEESSTTERPTFPLHPREAPLDLARMPTAQLPASTVAMAMAAEMEPMEVVSVVAPMTGGRHGKENEVDRDAGPLRMTIQKVEIGNGVQGTGEAVLPEEVMLTPISQAMVVMEVVVETTVHQGMTARLEMTDHPEMIGIATIGGHRGRGRTDGRNVGRTVAVGPRDLTGETASESNATFIDDRRCRQVISMSKARWLTVYTRCLRLCSNQLAANSESESEHCGHWTTTVPYIHDNQMACQHGGFRWFPSLSSFSTLFQYSMDSDDTMRLQGATEAAMF